MQLKLGAGTLCITLFLGFFGIPNWVSSPSNVSNIILSPAFWPYVLTAFTGLIALGLLLAGWRMDASSIEDEEGQTESLKASGQHAAWFRLVALAVIMALTMFALPRLGMVWTAMIVFMATALLFKTRHPIVAVICAVIIPLLLYAFFAHVAGISIPQGNFVRLP